MSESWATIAETSNPDQPLLVVEPKSNSPQVEAYSPRSLVGTEPLPAAQPPWESVSKA